MNIQSTLIKFIKACRAKGYSDFEIKKTILNKGYPLLETEKAFFSLSPKKQYKNQICLFLGNDVLDVLEKRAKTNMFILSEQIEDILRRSCATKKKKAFVDNIDDKFLAFFSRKKR